MPAPDPPVAAALVAEVPEDQAGASTFARALAALTAFGLGAACAVLAIAGHPPWEGPVVLGLTDTHGLHKGDVVAVLPLSMGAALAWWCWTRSRSPR